MHHPHLCDDDSFFFPGVVDRVAAARGCFAEAALFFLAIIVPLIPFLAHENVIFVVHEYPLSSF